MIDGVKINLGGENYVVPALNFKQIRSMQAQIEALSQMAVPPTDEQIDAMFTVVHAAISRNYPDVKKEKLDEMLDLNNAPRIVRAIMGNSGFEALQPGEAQAAGQ